MNDPKQPTEGQFAVFIASLAMSAKMQLEGAVEDNDGDPQINRAMARQTIEILEMLGKKTSGNLDEREEQLLGDLLYELRLAYAAGSAKEE